MGRYGFNGIIILLRGRKFLLSGGKRLKFALYRFLPFLKNGSNRLRTMLFVTRQRQCPRCQSDQFLQRSKRPVLYKLLFFVPSRAYRCYGCATKFVKVG